MKRNQAFNIVLIFLIFIFALGLSTSCHTFPFNNYKLSPSHINNNFKLISKNNMQFAVSRGRESIVVVTIESGTDGYTWGNQIALFIKVINTSTAVYNFEPKQNIQIYWSKTNNFERDSEHSIYVWNRDAILAYFRREGSDMAKSARASAIAGTILSGTSQIAGADPKLQQNAQQMQQQAQRYQNMSVQEYQRQSEYWNNFNDMMMNKDFLGENTLNPGEQVSGQVWATLKVEKRNASFDIRQLGASHFLMTIQFGKDIFEIYFDLTSVEMISWG